MEPMSNKSVNLKTLSENLGLSQTTVSRALNGFPEVAAKTRKRVIEAAEQLNYKPSPSAATLATGKAWSIGHVIPLSNHKMINPHFSDFIEGAGQIYSANNYDMLIRVVEQAEEEKVYRDFASRRRVDGVIVHGPLNDDPRISLIKSLNLPFVVHGRSGGEEQEYSWLDVDNTNAFKRATNLLIDLGHERIALLNGLEKMNFAKRRRAGFEAAMLEKNIPIDPSLILGADMVEPYGYSNACKMLQSDNPPTAFMASSILVAMGINRAIVDCNLLVGEDVSIIAFDDRLSFLQETNPITKTPYFTTMQSSICDAGIRAAEMLIAQIDNGSQKPVQELWEAQLVLGNSTRANKKAKHNFISGANL